MRLFFERLYTHRKRKGITLELITRLHIPNPTTAHHDFMLYSDASDKKTRDVVRAAWSGNKTYSLVLVEHGKLKFRTGYFAKKDYPPIFENEPRWIPKLVKHGGLRVIRNTKQFWGQDGSMETCWKRLWSDKKPQQISDSKTSYNIVVSTGRNLSNSDNEMTLKNALPLEPSECIRQLDFLAEQHNVPYPRALTLTRDYVQKVLVTHLPMEPQEAIDATIYAGQWMLNYRMVKEL